MRNVPSPSCSPNWTALDSSVLVNSLYPPLSSLSLVLWNFFSPLSVSMWFWLPLFVLPCFFLVAASGLTCTFNGVMVLERYLLMLGDHATRGFSKRQCIASSLNIPFLYLPFFLLDLQVCKSCRQPVRPRRLSPYRADQITGWHQRYHVSSNLDSL